MACKNKGIVTFCIINAPNDLLRDKADAVRLASFIIFDQEPQKDQNGALYSFVLSRDEEDATAVVCEVLSFRKRYLTAPAECTHVAWLRLINPNDYIKVCEMDDWKKIPFSAECEDPCVLDRG